MADGNRVTTGGYWLAPILIGLGYGIARSLAAGLGWSGFHAHNPVLLASFAGLLIALAMRPLLLRIPWSFGAALGLSLAVLLGVGPPAEWVAERLPGLLGLMPAPGFTSRPVLPEVVASVVGALLLALLLRPPESRIGLDFLRARLRLKRPLDWLWRFALLALLAGLARLLMGPLAELLDGAAGGVAGGTARETVSANGAWAGGAGMDMDMGRGTGPIGWAGLLIFHWLRGLALFLPLLPIALALRARWIQLTAVFALLFFVVGDFAPLLNGQPFTSLPRLLAVNGLAAARAFLLGGAAALLIGQLKRKGE